jgi:acyl carrier protein
MIPSAFVVLKELPLTPSGKLDRRSLPAPELGDYATIAYEHPEGDVEVALAEIWKDVLRVERVGRHDNFFDLGGHSLLAVRLMARVGDSFAVHMPVSVLLQNSTLREMAKVLKILLVSRSPSSNENEVEIFEGTL